MSDVMSPLALDRPEFTCTPPFWARSGHAQTLLGHLVPSRVPSLVAGEGGTEEHRIPVTGTDQLVGLLCPGTSDTVVHLFHGLGGDSGSDYVLRTAALARAAGHTVFAVNHRGCGPGQGLAGGGYHSGSADDLAAAIAYGRELRPAARHLAIGYSLSGNALLLLLSRAGPGAPDLAIAVNPPINLARSSELISAGLNRIYDLHFVHGARRSIRQRERDGLISEHYEIPRLARLGEVDDLYTAPAGGFESGADYYACCSTMGRLDQIEVPTVILTAADDPFIDCRDFEASARSDSVHLHVEQCGGHMGYFSRPSPAGTRRWLDYALSHYIRELLQASQH
jgi:uncharacterized protein